MAGLMIDRIAPNHKGEPVMKQFQVFKNFDARRLSGHY